MYRALARPRAACTQPPAHTAARACAGVRASGTEAGAARAAGAGVDWRQKLENQRGAVLATELKNNANKLAKWTAAALVSGADMIKLGYVSRNHPRDNKNHVILGTQARAPRARRAPARPARPLHAGVAGRGAAQRPRTRQACWRASAGEEVA